MAGGLTRAVLCAAIVAGILLRADGLARRPVWYDEAATLLHLGGRSEAGCAAWYDGRPLRRLDVLGAPAAPFDVVAAARADEPQSGPVYFALAAVWWRVVGESLMGLRALSAIASVCALGAAGLLAYRLFGDVDRALAVAALVALSPLHLRYAEEARPYALWTLALLVWMHATLGATRRGGRWAWVGQGAALVVALAIHPATLLALPAVLALAPGRPAIVASGIGVSLWAILGLPAWANGVTMGQTTAWVGEPAGIVSLVRSSLGVLTSVFFRPGGEGGLFGASVSTVLGRGAWVGLGLAALGLVGAGLRALSVAPRNVRRYVRRLAVVPWAGLAIVDVALGGRRSTIARYLVPSWLGTELAVGWRLGASGRARVVLVAVLGLAAGTALRTRGLDVWWDTDPPRIRAVAAIANAARARTEGIVLSDAAPIAVVELAAALGDDVELRLGTAAPGTVGAGAWERVVVAAASAALVAAVADAAGPARVLAPIPGAPGAWAVAARMP